MDAIRFLKEEHQKAKAAFGKIDGAPPDQRGELWRQLEPELKAHEQIEEQCFYWPLARDAQGKDSLLARWPERHQGDVREVEESLGEIDPLDPLESDWLARVRKVAKTLEKHIREEEGEIWPRAAQVWSRERLEQSGQEMEWMRAKKVHHVV